MIDFYYVDNEYIKFLQSVETKHRGFTRVPNMLYDNQNRKFVVGVVLSFPNYKYYAPITHYKTQKPNNILINIASDKKNPIKGSIRFNYMFPVLEEYVEKVTIKNILDVKQRRLMLKEYNFCVDNEQNIRTMAMKTYIDVICKRDTNLTENSCDFHLLENALNESPTITAGDSR